MAALIAAVSLFMAGPLIAQDTRPPDTGAGTIIGAVVAGHTGEPLPTTAVELRSVADSSFIATAETDAQGRFRIGGVRAGDYYVRLVHLDGAVDTAPFELVDGESRDLGTLRFPIGVITLAPLKVSVERSAVEFGADRTSYIVGLLASAEGASASQVIRTIPEMSVDIDGRVRRRGSEPAIYINDRPAPMSREALAAFLEQFPADLIRKIEVIDNPPARYRAEGAAGVINIVLKEGAELGVSGSAFVNAGTRGNYGGGAHGSLHRGRWALDGNAFLSLFSAENNAFDLRQNLIADPPFLRQDSRTERSGRSGNLHATLRYEPRDRVRLFVQTRISPSINASTGIATTTHMDAAEDPLLTYDRSSRVDLNGFSSDVATGIEYGWGPHQQKLKLDVRLRNGSRSSGSREAIVSEGGFGDGVLVPAALTLVEEDHLDRGASVDVDYTRPWGEGGGRIELGLQSSRNESGRLRTLLSIDDPSLGSDSERSDVGFDQEQRSYSAYTTLQRRVGRLGVQVGARAEHFELRFSNAGAPPLTRQYVDVFPTARLSYRLGNSRQLRLSYSRRTARPDASVLDPTDQSTDPLNRVLGNPDLRPQYTHALMLNTNWAGPKGTLSLSSHYSTTTNEWMPVTTVDSQGVSTRTQQNVASSTSYGAALSYALQRQDGLNGNLTVNGAWQVRDAGALVPHYSGNWFRWSAHAQLGARLFGPLGGEGVFSYSPPIRLPEGRRSDARYAADFGLRYRLPGDRASVRLSLQDPFALRRASSSTGDSTYIQLARSHESTRSAQLHVSYRLGTPGGMRRERGR